MGTGSPTIQSKSKPIHAADAKRGKICASVLRLVLVLHLMVWQSDAHSLTWQCIVNLITCATQVNIVLRNQELGLTNIISRITVLTTWNVNKVVSYCVYFVCFIVFIYLAWILVWWHIPLIKPVILNFNRSAKKISSVRLSEVYLKS